MSDTLSYNQTQPTYGGPIRGDNSQTQYPSGQQVYPQGEHGAPMQGQRPQNPLANYQFSSDELRVLRECNTESFFQRCIPLSTIFGVGTHLAVKRGVLSANPKFGSVPKVVVGVIVGYFLGKVSYQRKCAEKMMQLPNSKLGEILRQRKQGNIVGPLAPNQGLGTPGFGFAPFSTRSEDVYDDSHLKASNAQISALELDDTERPSFRGLDDSQSFGDLNSQTDLLPLEPPKKTVTYEELRKSNRDNYYKRVQSGNVAILQDQPTIIRVKEPTGASNKTDETEQMKSGPKNQYGDTWSQ